MSESNIYNNDCGLGCSGPGSGAAVTYVLNFIKNTGIVDEDCFKYPIDSPYCYVDCDTICPYPAQKVLIPQFDTVNISNNDTTALKRAIMDYGPLIVWMPGTYLGHPVGCTLHPEDDCEYQHAVLLIGWKHENGLKWHIKDSWPGQQVTDFNYSGFNIFNYSPEFYRVLPFDNNATINCDGSGCSTFAERKYVDNDHDGFYNWGFDLSEKPEDCPGPNKMDFNDRDVSVIFRDGYSPLPTPTVSGTTGPVCSDTGAVFFLKNVPDNFTTSWAITKNASCFNTSSGSGDSVRIYPNLSCVGKECEITFTISYDGTASYSKSFYINGPREDLVSISVLDSYGSPAEGSGEFFYLCANKNYTIYYNNNDFNCYNLSNFIWSLPYGWTKNYEYSNYVSINTNDYPYGYLQIYATTCCGHNFNLKNVYFGDANCDGYFMAYPNPADNSVEININRSMAEEDGLTLNGLCALTVIDKSGIIKSKNEFKGFPYKLDTSNLPKGIYFLNIQYTGKRYTIQLVVQH